MNAGDRKFSYRLESLLRLRISERDALGSEVQLASKRLDQKTAERRLLEREIQRLENELRSLCRSGTELSLGPHARLQSYLRGQREKRNAKQAEVDDATRALTVAIAEVQAKTRDTKTLEKHKSRARDGFIRDETRAAWADADDLWLRVRHSKEKG
jgi:hypothetical protein